MGFSVGVPVDSEDVGVGFPLLSTPTDGGEFDHNLYVFILPGASKHPVGGAKINATVTGVPVPDIDA